MISNELLEELQKLNRADKLRVIQILANDLASEEPYFIPGATYEILTPYDNEGAAETLLKMLGESQKYMAGNKSTSQCETSGIKMRLPVRKQPQCVSSISFDSR